MRLHGGGVRAQIGQLLINARPRRHAVRGEALDKPLVLYLAILLAEGRAHRGGERGGDGAPARHARAAAVRGLEGKQAQLRVFGPRVVQVARGLALESDEVLRALPRRAVGHRLGDLRVVAWGVYMRAPSCAP